jgi:hypothetical protein
MTSKCLGVEVVAFFAVLGDVETFVFVGGGDTQAQGLIDHEEQQGADDGEGPANARADGLVKELKDLRRHV